MPRGKWLEAARGAAGDHGVDEDDAVRGFKCMDEDVGRLAEGFENDVGTVDKVCAQLVDDLPTNPIRAEGRADAEDVGAAH